MRHPGWILVIIGLLIIGIGVVWLTAPSIPLLGKLPGDIRMDAGKFPILLPADDLNPAESLADWHHVVGAVFLTVTRIKRTPPCQIKFL